ncbi:MAG: hypothetical protein K9G58_07585 [Bacteroidales bacterium]|nr:hypothetical protein [Bacteroidales bacterium]MCF8387119.1 hypothetical protein [Bacteroidales bacterium]MCF8398011.1 hypothetical protein [Bacteroidales bacterium]
MTNYVNQLKKLAGEMGLKLQGYDTKTFRGNYRKKFYLIERDDKNPIVYLFADPGGNKIYSGLAIPLNLKYNLQLSISPEFLPGCLSLLFLDGWRIDKEILLDAKRILLTACEYLLHRRFVNP